MVQDQPWRFSASQMFMHIYIRCIYIYCPCEPIIARIAWRSPGESRLEDRGEILIIFGPDGLNLGNEFRGRAVLNLSSHRTLVQLEVNSAMWNPAGGIQLRPNCTCQGQRLRSFSARRAFTIFFTRAAGRGLS